MQSSVPENFTAPSAELIGRLLARLQVPFDAQSLAQAWAQPDVNAERGPAHWLGQVLRQAGLKNVMPVALAWRRFDRRRLPALVLHEGGWFLVERQPLGPLLLSGADGQQQPIDDAALQDAVVLWLRAPVASAKVPVTGNLAARLVWRELFRDRGWLSKIVVATVLVNLLAVMTSIFAMQVYDRVVPTMAYGTLTTLVSGMCLIVVLDWLLKTTRARIIDSLSCAVDQRVSQQVYEHLLHLRLDLQPRSLGTLAAQVSSLDAMRNFFSSGVIFALVDLPFALLFLAFIAIIGGAVGWVYALMLPVALVLGYSTQLRLRALLRQR